MPDNTNLDNFKNGLLKIKNEANEELVKIGNDKKAQQIQNNQKELNQRRLDTRADAMDKLAQGRNTLEPHSGQEIDKYQYLNKLAQHAISGEVNSFHDYRAAILELWKIHRALVDATAQSWKEVRVTIQNAGLDMVILPLVDGIKNKFFTGDPAVDLPILQHAVEFTKDNKLDIKPLTRSDNINETGTLDKIFSKGIHYWLNEQGYTETAANSLTFVDENGVTLDKATFDRLKDDPDHGLERFLDGTFDVSFRPQFGA